MGFQLFLCRAFLPIRSRLILCGTSKGHRSSVQARNAGSNSSISISDIRDEFSHHDPNVARINNGSFGCCPASVLAAQSHYQLLYLRQPDDFYFNILQPSILRSRSIIKEVIKATSVDQICIVDNVTTAAAIVFQHISWAFSEKTSERGEAVIILQHGYPAVKKSLDAYISRSGGTVIEIPVPFPVTSNEEVIKIFQNSLSSIKSKIRLAVIDHVTSMPSMVIPVKELTKICRDHDVDHVFVDGAHAIGNIDIDVEDIGADYYTSNLHKWFFCPPAAAFLHCRRSPDLHHPIVSHEHQKGLALECGWIGTRDYSAQLVLPSIIEFVERFEGGIQGIQKMNRGRVIEMGKMLAKSWSTSLGSPPEICSSMVMVGLPNCLGISSEDDAFKLRKYLREEFKVEVHIHFLHNEPTKDDDAASCESSYVTAYVRISHQVYNVVGDYYRLRDAINKLVHDGFTCKML